MSCHKNVSPIGLADLILIENKQEGKEYKLIVLNLF
jgi:hypothetical protein